MNKSKRVAIILGGLVLLWGIVLFVGLPFVYSKKVENLVGHPLGTVEEQLGPPTHSWTASEFSCHPQFPCTPGNAGGGPVLMYSDGRQAWYLYFDATSKLARLETVRPGGGGR